MKSNSTESRAVAIAVIGGHVSRSASLSDTESFHSPLRSESPLRSDDPSPPPSSKALVKFVRSQPQPEPQPVLLFTHSPSVKATDTEERGGERRGTVSVGERRSLVVKRTELGFRVCEAVFCLISFSVMAADKTEGWSGDSFDRYKEYRYCVAVTVIGFVYSSFQACDLAYNLSTGKYVFSYHLRHQFVFAMDQILAYLLISASSAAATRVDNWISNWGKDEFTDMASASIGMSFLAFGAFALSSLISGYKLCNRSTS